jgi:hypothetical protein
MTDKQKYPNREQTWLNTLKEVEQYIIDNKIKPSQHSKNEKTKKLGT